MRVNLHIERLVLDGLPVRAHEGPLVQAAIEAELTRLLGEGGFAAGVPRGWTAPLVRAEPIRIGHGDAAGIGAQVGQAIFEEVGK